MEIWTQSLVYIRLASQNAYPQSNVLVHCDKIMTSTADPPRSANVDISENVIVKKILRILLFVIRSSGVWPSEKSSLIYIIFGITYISIAVFIYTVFIIINIFNLQDIHDLIESIHLCFINVALSGKILTITLNNKKVRKMLYSIQQFRLIDDEERALVTKRMASFFKLLTVYYVSCNLALLGIDFVVLGAKEPQLVWKAWYPLDWQHNSLHYWIVYAYQAVGIQLTCNLNVSLDMFVNFLMCCISTCLEILGNRMKVIGHSRNTVRGGKERLRAIDSAIVAYEEKLKLIECIEMHKRICM